MVAGIQKSSPAGLSNEVFAPYCAASRNSNLAGRQYSVLFGWADNDIERYFATVTYRLFALHYRDLNPVWGEPDSPGGYINRSR